MIFFIGDACAVARVYLPHIGKANIVAIYRYPDSRFLTLEKLASNQQAKRCHSERVKRAKNLVL